jgi:hypothetical protein
MSSFNSILVKLFATFAVRLHAAALARAALEVMLRPRYGHDDEYMIHAAFVVYFPIPLDSTFAKQLNLRHDALAQIQSVDGTRPGDGGFSASGFRGCQVGNGRQDSGRPRACSQAGQLFALLAESGRYVHWAAQS